jgi:hypothetical protein
MTTETHWIRTGPHARKKLSIELIIAIALSTICASSALSSGALHPPVALTKTLNSLEGGAPTDAGAAQLTAAESSLARGQGPANGTPTNCAGGPTGGVSCGGNSGRALTSGTGSPAWSQVTYPTPAPRVGPAMAYDAHDNYVLLFGGYGTKTTYYGDTWKYSGGVWKQLTPSVAPPPRRYAAMDYDATDGYMVLYGGDNATTYFSDTWKFVAGIWTKLAPATNPGPRAEATASFDAKDQMLVLFGGLNKSGIATNVTWEFKGGKWSSILPKPSPVSRSFASMTYDAAASYILLFGGRNSGGVDLGDTWTFVAGKWTQLTPASSPSNRLGAALAYDGIDHEAVLLGGEDAAGYAVSDTWTFSGGSWAKIGPAAHPSNRYFSGVADGNGTHKLVLFGGISNSAYLNDTWTFQGAAWAKVVPRTPSVRAGVAMVYDEGDGYVLLFGGCGSGQSYGDTWKFAGGVWTLLHPILAPSPRCDAGIAYDQADGYVVLFGGTLPGGTIYYGDTWTYSGGVWTNLTAQNICVGCASPPDRGGAAMTYDYSDGDVVLFGGYSYTAPGFYYADTWTFSAGYWTELSPSAHPSAREYAAMTYDSEDGYVLLFGGQRYGGGDFYPDTWEFLAGVWTNITGSWPGGASTLLYPAMVDDTYDGYPLLVGLSYPSETFAAYNYTGVWNIASGTGPAGLALPGLAVDPAENGVLLFGGEGFPSGPYSDAAWVY